MKKIIATIKKIVKPGTSSRNTLARGIPRKITLTPWQRSQVELLKLFIKPQHVIVPTWSQSLRDLQAVMA